MHANSCSNMDPLFVGESFRMQGRQSNLAKGDFDQKNMMYVFYHITSHHMCISIRNQGYAKKDSSPLAV